MAQDAHFRADFFGCFHIGVRRPLRAFSLLELLVVLAILGLLVSLVLPAVQSARESARRITCASNVRQLAIAIQNFAAAHGHFPRASCSRVGGRSWCLSPSGQLIDYLDDAGRSDEIRRTPVASTDFDWNCLPIEAPAILHCPSDSLARGRAASYRYCRGILPLVWPEDPEGVFRGYTPISPRQVIDGLSNTAFVSERLIGTSGGEDRVRDPLVLPTKYHDRLAADCVSANRNGGPLAPVVVQRVPAGGSWLSGDWLHASYYHFFPPNSAWRDCAGDGTTIDLAMFSARSYHVGGVHVGFGDGRSIFVSDAIDLAVWRAWATRSKGETGGF